MLHLVPESRSIPACFLNRSEPSPTPAEFALQDTIVLDPESQDDGTITGVFQTYIMNSPKSGTVTFPSWMACRYQKGKAKTHGVAYLFFALLGNYRSPVLRVAEGYRHRFGIEASYRIMNAARATTPSTNASLRLLLVAIAFVLSNMWVWLKWNFTCWAAIAEPKHRRSHSINLP